MLPVAQFCSILVAALAGGLFWGPWLALTISLPHFSPELFLAVMTRLAHNIRATQRVLLPLALLLPMPVLLLSWRQPTTFACTLGGWALYLLAFGVTMLVEVPLVRQMTSWTLATLPPTWTQVRDRWAAFHLVRVGTAVGGLGLLLAGALAR